VLYYIYKIILKAVIVLKQKFDVTGMGCAACVARIEGDVGKMDGITAVSVNLLKNSMVAEFDESKTSADDIIKTVENAGYGASPVSAPSAQNSEKKN
jgi:Cu2+-exporting ATPase/Cu+-exporting ATPase